MLHKSNHINLNRIIFNSFFVILPSKDMRPRMKDKRMALWFQTVEKPCATLPLTKHYSATNGALLCH